MPSRSGLAVSTFVAAVNAVSRSGPPTCRATSSQSGAALLEAAMKPSPMATAASSPGSPSMNATFPSGATASAIHSPMMRPSASKSRAIVAFCVLVVYTRASRPRGCRRRWRPRCTSCSLPRRACRTSARRPRRRRTRCTRRAMPACPRSRLPTARCCRARRRAPVRPLYRSLIVWLVRSGSTRPMRTVSPDGAPMTPAVSPGRPMTPAPPGRSCPEPRTPRTDRDGDDHRRVP